MFRTTRCALVPSVLAASAFAQELPTQSPGISSYTMAVVLDPEQKSVSGTQTIVWRNTSEQPVDDVWLHLYINAFADRSSTLMREAGPEFRARWRDGEFGSVELESLHVVIDGASQRLTPEFQAPDDGNADDRTVVRAALPGPVPAGGTLELRTRFVTKLPKAYQRTGWLPGNGFFCMHWFPKLGVLETRDGQVSWNCHQFHAATEFFADFSRYDVTIEVPKGYRVGATGGLPESTKEVNGNTELRFVAEHVHDFAFVADPDFAVYPNNPEDPEFTFGPVKAAEDPTGVAQAVAAEMGVDVSTFDLPETKIRLLLRPEHDTATQRKRHVDAVKCALEFFGLRFGPYPYDYITVVDPGEDMQGRRLGGGMEYPMLITCGTSLFPFSRQQRPEGVTVHEFGHQYWYGLSANNEFEESWLDEGINSYSESRALTLTYGKTMQPVDTTTFGLLTVGAVSAPIAPADGVLALKQLPGLDLLPAAASAQVEAVQFDATIVPDSPLLQLLAQQPTAAGFRDATTSDLWSDRQRMMSVDNPDAMVRNGWEYASRASYGANSYQRPATVLNTLERMVGKTEWWTFMRRFHARARFAHPTTADFEKALGDQCGEAAAAFFEAATAAGAELDYGVHSVSPRDGKGPRKSVIIRRYGGVLADVRVKFTFAGRPQPVYRAIPRTETYPWVEFTFDVDENGQPFGDLLEVWVDPPEGTPGGEPFEVSQEDAGIYVLDKNLLNNGWKAIPNRRPALYRGIRALMQAQHQLTFAGIIG